MQYAQFGRRLGDLRVTGGFTQETLAERAGLSVRGISDLERGIRKPRVDTVKRIALALGIDGPALLYEPKRSVDIPAALDAFVGRDEELTILSAEIDAGEARLFSIVGVLGVGKSRLARELAARKEATFEHGAAFVRLCALENPDDFPTFLAHQLGERSFSALLERFRMRRFLLILDNAEHLAGVVNSVIMLLERVPMLTVICTSRKAFETSGERVWRLQPLPLPASDDPRAIVAAPSTRLLTTRGRERLAIPMTDHDPAMLARIVRGVDGLPLALELAAMRLSTSSLEEVAVQLSDIISAGNVAGIDRCRTHMHCTAHSRRCVAL